MNGIAILLLFCFAICTAEPSDFYLRKILTKLYSSQRRPTDKEWSYFRHICSDRHKQQKCSRVFDYIRTTLVPLEFPSLPSQPTQWNKWYGAGLPKYHSSPKYFQETKITLQFGDDSATMAGNFAILSDGITKDPNSDFFSFQLVEFLRMVLPRLDGSADLTKAVGVFEDLIAKIGLHGAATLLVAYRSAADTLWVATLGDSEARVLRTGEVIYHSPRQRAGRRHEQLDIRRPNSVAKMVVQKVIIQPDDYILLATDGLWDNVREKKMIEKMQASDIKDAIRGLMEVAMEMKRGQRVCDILEGAKRCFGARKDDITILAMKV